MTLQNLVARLFNHLCVASLFLVYAPVSTADDLTQVEHSPVTIWSQGVRLAGDLYIPKDVKLDEKLPGILLVPGWGGSKENLKRNYAAQFTQRGFVVLAFDYSSWGQSDGPLVAAERLSATEEAVKIALQATHVRKVVNPYTMLADVRAALDYLSGEPQVMPNNLGIWGTSFGGALSLVVAGSDDRIKAYVSQMGPMNFPQNYKRLPNAVARSMAVKTARGEMPPYPGPSGAANPGLKGYPDWAALKRFNPLQFVDGLQAPTLIIDAEDEALFDRTKNGMLLHMHIKSRVTSRYSVYSGKHYDMYKGDNLEAARQEAAAWFVEHLMP